MRYCLLIICLCLSACARQMSPDVYDADHIGEASATYSGTVVSVREVKIQDGDRLQDNALGGVGGGVAGALIGSTIGHGAGTVAAEIGGAVVGATAGALGEQALKKENGLEYIVKLESGEVKTVVQGVNPRFQAGDQVWMLVSNKGRSRLIAR